MKWYKWTAWLVIMTATHSIDYAFQINDSHKIAIGYFLDYCNRVDLTLCRRCCRTFTPFIWAKRNGATQRSSGRRDFSTKLERRSKDETASCLFQLVCQHCFSLPFNLIVLFIFLLLTLSTNSANYFKNCSLPLRSFADIIWLCLN